MRKLSNRAIPAAIVVVLVLGSCVTLALLPATVNAEPPQEPLYWRQPQVTVNFSYLNPNTSPVHSYPPSGAGKVGTVVAVIWNTTGNAATPNGSANLSDVGGTEYAAIYNSSNLVLDKCYYATGHSAACTEFGYSGTLSNTFVGRVNSNDDIEIKTAGNFTQIDITGYFQLIYEYASITPTPTLTPSSTASPTPAVVQSIGNYLRDGSFDSNPDLAIVGLSPWQNSFWDVDRKDFSPADQYIPYLNSVTAGCGDNFYELNPQPGHLPIIDVIEDTGTYLQQNFSWTSGNNMYISLMARTGDTSTFGIVRLITPDNQQEILEPQLTNVTGQWQFFYWMVPNADPGTYALRVDAATVGTTDGQLAVDMAAVHEGYWHNDCGNQTAPYWLLNDSARITATPGTPGPSPTVPVGYLTQLASNQTAIANSTSNANATATHVAEVTGTQVSAGVTQGWQTATKIAQGVQTLVANGQGTQGAQTQTAVANRFTATARYVGTATQFVSDFRGTLTAQAQATQTHVSVVQTQAYGSLSTRIAVQSTLAAQTTATHAAHETEVYAPGIIAQLTLQAALQATNAAVLTQQANGQGTAIAQATAFATTNATTIAQLTQIAQVQSTLQALSTAQATQAGQIQLTVVAQTQNIPMPPAQPEPYWAADCSRPDNALNIAWWIEYSVCYVLSWVTPNQANFQQLSDPGLEVAIRQKEPFGTIAEILDTAEVVQEEAEKYDWVHTGYQGGREVERQNIVQLALMALDESNPLVFSSYVADVVQVDIDYCHTQLISVFSTNVAQGVCIVWGLLFSFGILAWIQFFFDLAVYVGFIRLVWKVFME